MRVSVLIPVYNCRKYVGEAIESVLKQTFRDFEIIVVDDGSDDGTASIVQKYEAVRYIYQPHAGVATARNRALQEARGELIDFLDADDIMHPQKLEKQVNYIDTHVNCRLVFCRYRNFSALDILEMTEDQRRIMEKPEVYLRLASTLMSADLFDLLGPFDPEFNCGGEDTEWMMGLKAKGIETNHFIDEVLYLRRIHESNLTLTYHLPVGKECLKYLAKSVRRSIKGKKILC